MIPLAEQFEPKIASRFETMRSLLTHNFLRHSTAAILILLGIFLSANTSLAQEPAEISDAEARYNSALLHARKLAKECRTISIRFFDGSLAESYKWKEKWPGVVKELSEHKVILEQATIDWFLEHENPPLPLIEIASGVSSELYDAGKMQLAYQVLKKIRKFYPKKDIMLDRRFALTGIKSNHFDFCVEFIKNPLAKEAVDKLEEQLDKNLFGYCRLFAQNWVQEAEIRQKEAEADDLPRVKLQLDSGELIIELFENEAPETVANFIRLVEDGFYDGCVFHPVVKDIVAQSGQYHRTRSIGLDYVIKNESRLPNSRRHFVGSLSMASTKKGDSTPSTFAVSMLPSPELDWDGTSNDEVSQTVFGRVVTGMENIMTLPVTMEIDPETNEQKHNRSVNPGEIQKATVIRKRDHQYKFEKITPQ